VKDGDCLWDVAAHQLGTGASNAAIAKEVTRLWKLNAEHIGTDDPDLIFAGQTLVV
jgi:nucleoid-associated protein YgaU